MVERLLLDGIDAEAGRPSVAREKDLVADALADEAEGSLAVVQSAIARAQICLLYTSPSPRDRTRSRMPSSA